MITPDKLAEIDQGQAAADAMISNLVHGIREDSARAGELQAVANAAFSLTETLTTHLPPEDRALALTGLLAAALLRLARKQDVL
jgi:hypothetical protein